MYHVKAWWWLEGAGATLVVSTLSNTQHVLLACEGSTQDVGQHAQATHEVA